MLLACAISLCALIPLLTTGPALAAEATPQWTISAVSRPTNLPPNDSSGENHYRVLITNSGSAPTTEPITISDVLPPGLTLAGEASGFEQIENHMVTCTGLQCTYSETLPPGDTLSLSIPVDVSAAPFSDTCPVPSGAEGCLTNVISVSGGGAPEATRQTATVISSAAATFGIAPGSAGVWLSSDQAGAHADLTTTLAFNTINHEGLLAGNPKDTTDNLPPGFVGDLVNMPTCELAYFSAHNECPVDTQVGTTTVFLHSAGEEEREETAPVYNLAPAPGSAAKLAFYTAPFGVQGEVSVRPPDEGLETSFHNIDTATTELDGVALTIWGVPADPSHEALRGLSCDEPGSCGRVGGALGSTVTAFLTNPTSCSGQSLQVELQADSWEQRGTYTPPEKLSFGPLTGCEHLTFTPTMTAEPTTMSAESPTGLNVNLEVPQTFENPYGLATSALDEAVVTLPEGMSLNPSAAAGLGYCTQAQLESETATSLQGEGCPSDAKIGTVRIKSPVISEEATGAVYVAEPYENQFGSLFAIYVVAKIPDRGVIVRTAGKIEPNPLTGQLTTTFPENPPIQFNDFTLSFRQGATAALVTPPTCGTFAATGELTPWSAPSSPSSVSSSFQITHGVGGGPCPGGGAPPFAPLLSAGTLNNVAGSYSPLDIHITRDDGEQEITGFSTQLPPGLSANLTGVPFCSEADIALARTKTGAQEEAEPSCPAASQIGHTVVGAGVGPSLVYTPGTIYMAGPFEGAPFSIVSITPAKVGPFDLGTVVVHLPLDINPETAAVTIPTGAADQIPHIIKGVPIHVREIRAYVDRADFTVNPTSCERMSLAATVIGGGADPTNPADNNPVTVSDPFQAADCANLAFKPSLSASTPARTSKADGAGLTVKLTYPSAAQGSQANLKYVKVDLPKQLPSRLTTLQKACLAKVFQANPAACPPESIVGHARALTPILPVPLTGPAYFVSNGGQKFPELVVVLQGYGVTIDLHGETFISKQGITSSTFRTIPDQPVTSFELTLLQGNFSALAANLPAKANGSLCGQKLEMPTEFIAQNGAVIHQSTPMAVMGCGTLTRRQRLAAALKACRKKLHARRASCEQKARREYGSLETK